jgi:hypothetical protein
MSKPTSRVRFPGLVAAATIFCFGGTGLALAQSAPDTENGRYALSPVEGGVIRLDTRTGAVSTCSNSNGGWACHAAPDERAAMDEEIGRLQADNEKLKAQLTARDALPKADTSKAPEPKVAEDERKIEIPKIEIPLPSDRDMDRVMSFLEQAWRRLVEMANQVQKDVSGKI